MYVCMLSLSYTVQPILQTLPNDCHNTDAWNRNLSESLFVYANANHHQIFLWLFISRENIDSVFCLRTLSRVVWNFWHPCNLSGCAKTLSQSPYTALTAGICLPLGLCKGTVSGLWKTVEIPTGHVSSQSTATWGVINLYLDRPITRG